MQLLEVFKLGSFNLIAWGLQENPAFSKPVVGAQFYFVDKFIILASGSSLYLYKYSIDSKKSDIQRYLLCEP